MGEGLGIEGRVVYMRCVGLLWSDEWERWDGMGWEWGERGWDV